jgi:hypothetical protein
MSNLLHLGYWTLNQCATQLWGDVALFIILGIYQYVNYGLSDALPSFGIALAFDPFNPQQKWNDRPLWQKIWLTTHALAVLTALAFILFGS